MKTTTALLPLVIALSLGLAACGGERTEERLNEMAAEQENGGAMERDEAMENGQASMASEEEAMRYTSSDLPETAHEGELDTLDTLLQGIRQEVGNPAASQRDECRVIGVGHRPCGGPERYLLYSVQTTDESRLLPMVERYNALVRQRVEEEGMVGTCEVLPEPGVIVRNGVCVAAERAER